MSPEHINLVRKYNSLKINGTVLHSVMQAYVQLKLAFGVFNFALYNGPKLQQNAIL